jgi:hypothetical protein
MGVQTRHKARSQPCDRSQNANQASNDKLANRGPDLVAVLVLPVRYAL